MRVSVVIPTYRRPENLAACLDALEHQQLTPAETIVVVRSGDVASEAVVRSRARTVRLVLVERPGVVAAMNAGIAVSTGEIVALTDDDSEPHADWLGRMVATYESDSRVAAVGGRDVLYLHGKLFEGSAHRVGVISWFGRVSGNHHIGVGAARDVDVLKGVNLSVRGDLLRAIRIDERMRGVGTEHHWELALCVALRRRGLRVVYDPAIAVDHHPQPRIDDSRRFSARELRDSRHNETIAVLEHLRAWQRPLFVAWAFAIGTGGAPGVANAIRLLPSRGGAGSWSQFWGAQTGLLTGLLAWIR
jgi:GT2 family glycosyltransferase